MITGGIRPGHSRATVESGEIIHMVGDPQEIWSRLITKRKETSWPPERIHTLQETSKAIYLPLQPHFVNATGRKEIDVMRDIAKIIFSPNYNPKDIDSRLIEISNENQE
ncbi:hypothetical protein D9M68_851910 [compost metagenome]